MPGLSEESRKVLELRRKLLESLARLLRQGHGTLSIPNPDKKMLARVLIGVVAGASAFQVGLQRPAGSTLSRSTTPVALELPSLPSLPGLPSLGDLINYEPEPNKKNEMQFDKDGRMIKGPKVNRKIESQKTADNTKTKK